MEAEIRQNNQGKLSLNLKDEVSLKDDYIGNSIENFDIIKILVEREDNINVYH